MPIPENPEPGAISGQQLVVQQQQSIKFSSAIPIKKRRFPIIESSSPPREEKPVISEDHKLKNTQDYKIPDEGLSSIDARTTSSPANSDVSKTSSITVKKEVSPTNVQLGEAGVDTFASKALELKPSTSLGPLDDLRNRKDILQSEKCSESEVVGNKKDILQVKKSIESEVLANKKDILQDGKSSEPEFPNSSMASQTAKVKQEIVSGQTEVAHLLEPSTGKMNIELSLGLKEPLVPALKDHNSEAFSQMSDKSDSSLLSLALHKANLVLHDNNDNNRVYANRSNWDLNTTMDVWEGSTRSNADAFAHRLVHIGGLSTINSCDDVKSTLTTAGTVSLNSNKGKRILDGHASSFAQPSQQCKADDSLRLRLATPYLDISQDCSSLSDTLVSTSVSPNINLKQVQLSTMNVNRTVKSEPVDHNSKPDCSVGSSSSTNMELLKSSSVKTELANCHSLKTVLPSSISPEKSVDCRSIKSEVVVECNQGASKSKDDAAMLQSVGRLMQHQERSVSSCALPVPLIHQNPCTSTLGACSELTTSGYLSNQSAQSLLGKKILHNDIPDESIASMVSNPVSQNEELSPCKVGSLSVVDADKRKLAPVDEHMHELSQNIEVAANDEEKINASPAMLEEDTFGSDIESEQSMKNGEDKEDEEYEDGEVREPMQLSVGEDPNVEGKKNEKLELAESDSRNFQPSVPLADQNIHMSDFVGKDAVKKNQEETHSDPNEDCVGICPEPNSEVNSLHKLSDKVLVVVQEKSSISATADKIHNLSGKDVQDNPQTEVLTDIPTNDSHEIGVEPGYEATEKVVKENFPGEDDSTLYKVEASFNSHDTAKDSSNVGNKSRIINLSRASVVTSPSKTKSIPNRLLTSRSGKERYSDVDGDMQPRGNRDEFYTGGPNKFVKDRVHNQSFRNSRPNFMFGKGRKSGRFGSLRTEWDSEHDFSSETSYGPSDYRVIRRKNAPPISDVELECNGYGGPQDGTTLGNNRRKTVNDEFSSVRRTSLRRLSSGDRDGPVTRGVPMLHRVPRNMSPRRCANEAGSDMIGFRHDDNFMRLSDDIIDPVYNRPQAMYDELDGQLVRGNRNFSTLQRKVYPRIHSKSPVRSRTRSPGPWSSPRRRSPNGLPELTQHRSPALYRMGGRMRSPERPCFRDELVGRRHGSPSFVARHTNNDLRDVDSGREHVHPRNADSNRRGSPGRVFNRNTRRADALDSREMGDGDEYMNGTLPSNKFHDLRGDGSIDERRKFIERRGPLRSLRPSYGGENENFRFHMNDGPRPPYRFCPDGDAEFVERNNMREREFDGRMKHQPLVVPRRIRNIEEQQDGNFRPVDVWHEDGFSGGRGKRRRF